MARPVKVDPDRPGLMECLNCGNRFGARGRQKGYEFEEGIKWELDDKRLRCPNCDSDRIKLVGS
jgi:Zn finger protein HypA/HybF involved in hydrogenase expression